MNKVKDLLVKPKARLIKLIEGLVKAQVIRLSVKA